MKGLSLTQPWATLVAIGAKKIETRSWGTNHRGFIAIHAAKGLASVGGHDGLIGLCLSQPFRSALVRGGAGLAVPGEDTPLGAIVAVARLTDVLPIVGQKLLPGRPCVGLDDEGDVRVWTPDELPQGVPMHVGDGHEQPAQHEAAFGDYTPGRFAWLLDDVRPLADPIPCRGALGLWDVPADVQARIDAQIGALR